MADIRTEASVEGTMNILGEEDPFAAPVQNDAYRAGCVTRGVKEVKIFTSKFQGFIFIGDLQVHRRGWNGHTVPVGGGADGIAFLDSRGIPFVGDDAAAELLPEIGCAADMIDMAVGQNEARQFGGVQAEILHIL